MFNLGKEFLDIYLIYIYGYKFQILWMGFLFIILIGDVIFINDLRCSEFLINEESLCYSVKWGNKIWNNFSNIFDINF